MSDSHAMCLSILLQSPPTEFNPESIFTGVVSIASVVPFFLGMLNEIRKTEFRF